MKLALILYVARYLADNPKRLHRGLKQAIAPIAVVVGPALRPDLCRAGPGDDARRVHDGWRRC